MRVYEAKLIYSLLSLGDEIRLERPEAVVEYLRSAFDEHPMQEAFYCVYLDRKGHPLGRHLITLGTVDSTLVSAREVFRGAILAGASSLIVAHNLCAAAHRLCYPSALLPGPAASPSVRHTVSVYQLRREAHPVMEAEFP